MSDADEHVSA